MKNSLFYLILLLMTAFSASAYDFEQNGVYYNIITNGVVQVTYRNTDFNSYSGYVGIPPSVTYNGQTYRVQSIDDNAFAECTGLQSVTIPSSVIMIGTAAFFGCSELTHISIPPSVTDILDFAFYGCENLGSINCLALSPPDVGPSTFDPANFRFAYLFVPQESLSNYRAADYWKKFTATKSALNFALNVGDGDIQFFSGGDYPWMSWADGYRIHAVSGNRSVHNSTSTMSAYVRVGEGTTLSFEFNAMGKGESTVYDKCIFSIDGVQQFCYGARDAGWESYSVKLSGGNHTLTWTYEKNYSSHPLGDSFSVDNIRLTRPPITGDVNGDGQVNISDAIALITYLGTDNPSGINLEAANCNGDGDVNISDVTVLINMLLTNPYPDYYIVGNEPFGGWIPDAGVKMTRQDDGIYTYKATINGPVWFVFADGLDSNWEVFNRTYRIGPIEDEIVGAGEWYITQKSANDEFRYGAYKFTGTGNEYTFMFDPFLMLFKIDGIVSPTVFSTYTVAGEPVSVFGTEWDTHNTDNEMTKLSDGTYELLKTGCHLSPGTIKFKVVGNNDFNYAWPLDDFAYTIAQSGVYNIRFTFNPATGDPGITVTKTN